MTATGLPFLVTITRSWVPATSSMTWLKWAFTAASDCVVMTRIVVISASRVNRCPLADAVISRRAECAADRFAADHGLAIELAAALHTLNDGGRAGPRSLRRLSATQPPMDRRIAALSVAKDRSGAGSPAPTPRT